jgi:hypothetical protein
MPIENFQILDNVDDTLKLWKRKLEYMFQNLDDDNVTSTSLTLGTGQVKASNIDFGTGANQVDAGDIPIVDTGSYYASDTVNASLQQIGSTITTHFASTTLHYLSSSITTLVPINSTNILYVATTAFNALSTTLTGTTTLTLPVALSSDLIVTNNTINDIRTRLLSLGIYTT